MLEPLKMGFSVHSESTENCNCEGTFRHYSNKTRGKLLHLKSYSRIYDNQYLTTTTDCVLICGWDLQIFYWSEKEHKWKKNLILCLCLVLPERPLWMNLKQTSGSQNVKRTWLLQNCFALQYSIWYSMNVWKLNDKLVINWMLVS